MILTSHLKNPKATDPQGFATTTINSYTVHFRRTDGGTLVPPDKTFRLRYHDRGHRLGKPQQLPDPRRLGHAALTLRSAASLQRGDRPRDESARDPDDVRHHVLRIDSLGHACAELDGERHPALPVLGGARRFREAQIAKGRTSCAGSSFFSPSSLPRWWGFQACAADSPAPSQNNGNGGGNYGDARPPGPTVHEQRQPDGRARAR